MEAIADTNLISFINADDGDPGEFPYYGDFPYVYFVLAALLVLALISATCGRCVWEATETWVMGSVCFVIWPVKECAEWISRSCHVCCGKRRNRDDYEEV